MKNKEEIFKKPELLAPGGSYEKAVVAFLYGADAVYVGLPSFSLREQAKNLNLEEVAGLSFLTKKLRKKLYLTLNIFARQEHLKKLPEVMEYLADLKVDGFIISDPGVIRLAKKYAPHIPIHLSTQANTTNLESILFWRDIGVKRVNLARELSYEEAKKICVLSPLEIEIFVHGAMCISYSGRCLLSSIMTGKSANLGMCTHPCRWSYKIVEATRPNDVFTVEVQKNLSYILNSKDLCLLEKLPDIVKLSVDALKIEGRVKSFLYVATVVSVYKRAINSLLENPSFYEKVASWMDELRMVSHRPYTYGPMFVHSEETESQSQYIRSHALAGLVIPVENKELDLPLSDSFAYIQVRRTLDTGQEITFLKPDGDHHTMELGYMEKISGQKIQRAHPGMIIRVPVEFPVFPYQVIRVKLD